MNFRVFMILGLVPYGLGAPQYGGDHDFHHQHHEVHELHTTPIPILQHKSERHKDGYQFSFKTGNGIQAEESGYVKKTGEKEDDSIVVMHGTVSYTGPDGVPVKLTYVADEHGFQPQGSHLPTPPPLPVELQKAYDEALQHQHHETQHHEIAYEEEHQQYQPGHY